MLEKSTYITNCRLSSIESLTIVYPDRSDSESSAIIFFSKDFLLGNQMSMYEHDVASTSVDYYLAERNIYGSSRLGTTRDTINMFLPPPKVATQLNTLPSYGVVGNRNYELSNHLGNVLAVVNDVIYPLSNDNVNITSYETGLLQVSDYSPFGVQLDGRTISNGDYRYGFQGQEMDDEVKGEGNSVNYKYRMHDPRVGRFFAVDPLKKKYPFYSPYAFSGNRVLDAVEFEGLEPLFKDNGDLNTAHFEVFTHIDIMYDNKVTVYKKLNTPTYVISSSDRDKLRSTGFSVNMKGKYITTNYNSNGDDLTASFYVDGVSPTNNDDLAKWGRVFNTLELVGNSALLEEIERSSDVFVSGNDIINEINLIPNRTGLPPGLSLKYDNSRKTYDPNIDGIVSTEIEAPQSRGEVVTNIYVEYALHIGIKEKRSSIENDIQVIVKNLKGDVIARGRGGQAIDFVTGSGEKYNIEVQHAGKADKSVGSNITIESYSVE